ncbi:MAG: DUF488 domain-containing protein [Desulfobacterales bacterium]|nr:DUF488 domain-containing protein [Desulfobacterales bacterium]MBS3756131.1 DUF488 domain-containing protein [Desulfobacterales bacterium]
MLYTIGYQKITAEQLIDILAGYGVDTLVDVRSRPYTSKKGFHRRELEKTLPERGITYCWAGDRLGGFGRITETAIFELAGFVRDRTVCLMCMEADPDQCHRKTEIARRLAACNVAAHHLIID